MAWRDERIGHGRNRDGSGGHGRLTRDDVVEGRRFDDVVARGFFPVDIHDPTGSKGYQAGGSTWIKPKGPYDIPLRCLVPQRVDGVLMTGRNISAAHEAHGSLRVQGTAFAIGHASGAAAAIAALDNRQPRDVDVRKVQRLLIAQHANLDIDAQAPLRNVA